MITIELPEYEASLGEVLTRARLALTALDLSQDDECRAILSSLIGWLVERDAFDAENEAS